MTDPLSTALEAHRRGWTPLPLRPGTKKPARPDWQHSHLSDEAAVLTVFAEAAAETAEADQPLNVGLALGAQHNGLVDIDLDHPKATRLAATLLPHTAMRSGREGSPGSHYWYKVTGSYDPGIRRYSLPSRQVIIEYRGTGGQTVAPGSIHPEGDEYRWESEPWGGTVGPAEVTGEQLHGYVMLVALIVLLADAWPARGGRHDAYLALVGGLLRDADDNGQARPHPFWNTVVEPVVMMLAELTHDTDGPRTRVAESVPSTRRKLIEGKLLQGWPTLAELLGERTVEMARALVLDLETLNGAPRKLPTGSPEQAPGADTSSGASTAPAETEDAADRALRLAALPPEQRDPMRERGNSWEPVDLVPYLLGNLQPIQPKLLLRQDGAPLIYQGVVNSLYGSSGSGKTWLALLLARQVMAGGDSVLMIDFEDTPHGALSRLLQLDPDRGPLLGGQFGYIAPEEPLSGLQVDRFGQLTANSGAPATARGTLSEALRRTDPALVIIDGVTTLYGTHGLNTNDAVHTDAVARWLRGLTDHGRRTVLLIDHTAKNAGPGSTPMGSQHKVAMVQGAALQVYATDKPRVGVIGKARVYVGKDRHSGVYAVSTHDDPAVCAEVIFDSTGGVMVLTLEAPEVGKAQVDLSAVRTPKAPGRPVADRDAELRKIVKLMMARGSLDVTKPAELTRTEIITATGLSGAAVSVALHEAMEAGRIVRLGVGPSTRYRLPDGPVGG